MTRTTLNWEQACELAHELLNPALPLTDMEIIDVQGDLFALCDDSFDYVFDMPGIEMNLLTYKAKYLNKN